MAKPQNRYVCQQCGAAHPRWQGRCEACGAWNSIVEELPRETSPRGLDAGKGKALAFSRLDGAAAQIPRRVSGIVEFDRVCGGGLVPASAVLVGGDPGIGKSTLLLQVIARLAGEARVRLHLGRGGNRPGAHARRPHGPRVGSGRACRRHQHPRHPDEPRHPRGPRGRGDRLDPDHVRRHPRLGTRHRRPGARRRPGADPGRQAARQHRALGRPRHQGGPNRRPARARAHGRHGALFRGRARPPVPHPARGQEPLRADRRDRRVRDDRPRAHGGRAIPRPSSSRSASAR